MIGQNRKKGMEELMGGRRATTDILTTKVYFMLTEWDARDTIIVLLAHYRIVYSNPFHKMPIFLLTGATE